MVFDRIPHRLEHPGQCVFFGFRHAQWVKWVNARKFECSWFKIRAFEGFNVGMHLIVNEECSILIHIENHHGELEQRVGVGIKSTGF